MNQQQIHITGLQCLAVLMNINNMSAIFVSAYQSSSRNMHIVDYDNVASLHNYSIIMAGDLSFKHTNWGYRVNNPNSIKLQTLI